MKRLSIISLTIFTCLIVFGIATVSTQAAILNITVTDKQTGDNLNSVSITVKHETGDADNGVTDANGTLAFADLAAGEYTITASLQGYTDNVMTNVSLNDDETKSITISLNSEIIELEKISVSASRRKEKVLEAPASVALVDDSQIKDRVALSVTEHIKSIRAVDVITSGIGTSYVVVRGFNNVFSGNLLSLVDNRIASVPSLRVNAYTLIPTISEDIEQIEVVSGPGAALYGPNSANGVMHILTRSPFNSQGTTLSIGGGERGLLLGSLRHAGVINDMIGYKLTANYTQGNDWAAGRLRDDVEPGFEWKRVDEEPGFIKNPDYEINEDEWQDDRLIADINEEDPRNSLFDTSYIRAEFRVDYSPDDDTSVIIASGLTQASGLELTGIGAGLAKNWNYGYAQTRVIYKDLFFQAFINRSDAGDTYVLRTQDKIVDNSDQYVSQLQHSIGIGDIQRFTYGLDVLLTRPDTGETINGVNEESDNIDEIGVYVQSETNILPQVKLLAAGRADYHNHLNDIVLSPRVALAFQPDDDHNIRLTYNRAFNTPGTSNLFLDILSSEDAYGLGANFQSTLGFSPNIDIRAQGVPSDSGFTFRRNTDGRPLFRSSFAPLANLEPDAYLPLDDPLFTNVMWGIGRGAVIKGFEDGLKASVTAETLPTIVAGMPAEEIVGIIETLPPTLAAAVQQVIQPSEILGLSPEQLQQTVLQLFETMPSSAIDQLAATLIAGQSAEFADVIPEQILGLKNVIRSLDPETGMFLDVEDVKDVDVLKPTITQTYEVGYKGILMNILAFSVDVYHSRINNFIGPLFVETPNVFLDPASIQATFGAQITETLADPENAVLNQSLLQLDVKENGGNGNGTPVDELITTFASIPFGTVTPEQAVDPNAVMLTYRNYGDISLNGLDLNFTLFLSSNWSVGGNYSFVSKDLFQDIDGIGDIALNAPKNKFGANIQYFNTDLGLGAGLRARFVEGFPVRSGVYVGEVKDYFTIDLNAGYDIPFGPKPRFSVTVQNLLDRKHNQFVGTPDIGRLAIARLTQTF